MKDKREECGCHVNCTILEHDCLHPCIWPSCLTDEESAELVQEIVQGDAVKLADRIAYRWHWLVQWPLHRYVLWRLRREHEGTDDRHV